jgi:hypothetical protein
LLLIALLAPVGFSQSPQPPFWVGFRYDETRIVSYVARMEDPVEIKQKDLTPLKAPVTRGSWCGYHLALTSERLHTFKPLTGTVPKVGQHVTVILDANTTVAASVDGYIEDWHGDTEVAVAILAQVVPADRSRFQETKSGYFLISTQQKAPPPPVIPDPTANVEFKTRVVLNRFGSLGELIERTAEAGNEIRLFRTDRGSLQPTAVATGCSD